MGTWSERIGLERPIVQAGMGGGLATAPLAGAVSAAGGLGTVGIMPAPAFGPELRSARDLAGEAPLAANLLLPFVRPAHVAACIAHRMRVVVLHGGLSGPIVTALRDAGIEVLQQVGTVDEARRALRIGADGVIVQGTEAGGHTYARRPVDAALADVRAALPSPVPVLAAGGVNEAADVRRLLDAGADAVVVGTRFLATPESRAHPGYKRALIDGRDTVDTLLFGFGWPMRHRVLRNAAVDRWCAIDERGPRAVRILSRVSAPIGGALPLSLMAVYPRVQRPWLPVLTPGPPLEGGGGDRILRASALYAGQGVGAIDRLVPAADLVATLAG
ncbi:MAG: nitronate monooxygenase [Solirubrobacteraceae bacterium]|nr:nitronate monooxygenase [Solirubrobacteraceae bacterium]